LFALATPQFKYSYAARQKWPKSRGKYLIKINEYQSNDELKDNVIYIQIGEDEKISYTLKSLNGELTQTELSTTTRRLNTDITQQIIKVIQTK